MLKHARNIEFLLTPSERDALLLESNLIKHHQPPYNVLLKDDETYPYICASIGDPLPSFSLVPRQLTTPQARNYKYFGPYPSFREINEVLQAIENTYELRAKNFQVRYGSMLQSEYQKDLSLKPELEKFKVLYNQVKQQKLKGVKIGKTHKIVENSTKNGFLYNAETNLELHKSIIIERLETLSCSKPEVWKKEYSCPICFEDMKPPLQIYACAQDHFICSVCLKQNSDNLCPMCRDDFNKNPATRRPLAEKWNQ